MSPLPTSLTAVDSATNSFNGLTTDKVKELCINVLHFLLLELHNIPIPEGVQILQTSANLPLNENEAASIVNSLCSVYRRAALKRFSPADLSSYLSANSAFSSGTIAVISKTWAEEGEALCKSRLVNELNIGELLSLDWKLSVAMTSNNCRNLNSPTVTLLLKILDSDGKVSSKSLEMNYEQFKIFSSQVREMKTALDSV